MAEDEDLGLGDEAEAEDGEPSEEDASALEEAVSGGEEGEDEDLDPLAEEMLKMMEEEGGDGDSDSGEDVDQMMEAEMLKAMEEEGGAGGGAAAGLAAVTGGGVSPNLGRLMDVSLTVTIELGRTKETIEKVMKYDEQSLIELDRTVGEPVDVLVNGEPFARGEVVTVSENFGVRILELVNPAGSG